MVGISQKNGTVVTHLKIGARPEDISAVRVARGHADLILGCDLVTSASERILAAASRTRTRAVINSHEVMPATFTHDANFDVQGAALTLRIAAAVKQGGLSAIDATEIATKLLGDSIAANLFTLGYAWQKGLVPVSRDAIAEAPMEVLGLVRVVKRNDAAVELTLINGRIAYQRGQEYPDDLGKSQRYGRFLPARDVLPRSAPAGALQPATA